LLLSALSRLRICKRLCPHLHLKDIETVEGEPQRLARWTKIVKEEIGKS